MLLWKQDSKGMPRDRNRSEILNSVACSEEREGIKK